MKKQTYPPLVRFIASVLLLAVSALSWAYDFEAGGICYNINDDGTSVTVTYRTTSYNSYSGDVVIPATVTYNSTQYNVTSIGNRAFSESAGLTSVTIGNNVTSIGDRAFYSCPALTDLTIPNNVNSIGEYCVYDCAGLTTLTIGSGVTSVGASAFRACEALKEVYCMASQVPNTGSNAFLYSNTSATLYVVAAALNDYKAANQWSGFGTITTLSFDFVSDGIYYIINGDGKSVTVSYAKEYEASYSGDVVIPSTVSYGGNEYSVTNIYRNAFYNCHEMTSITIPETVKNIDEAAFRNCTGLTEVSLGDGVTNISDYAFYGCTSLTSFTIPKGVTSIRSYVFYDCTGLKSVNIHSGVTKVGDRAFARCSGLKEVFCWATSVPTTASYAFQNASLSSATLYVPESAVDTYKSASPWSGFGTIVSPSFDFVSDGIYYIINGDGKSVTVSYAKEYEASYSGDVVIPSTVSYGGNEYSVTNIYRNAFYNCHEMTSITIPETVKNIDEAAFRNCTGLTEVSLGDGVTNISDYAFYGCTSLTSFTIPKGVTSIRSYVFYDCTGLKSVNIHSGVTKVGDRAFARCSSLKEVFCWATSVPTTASYAFQNASLSSATLYVPESAVDTYKSASPWSGFGTVSLVPYDFEAGGIYYKINTDGVSVSVSIKSLEGKCYSGLVEIPSSVTYADQEYSVTGIGDYSFYNCTDLTSVTVPNSVTSIGKLAFYNCSALASILIPEGVTEIGESAFLNCSALTSITIPNSVAIIRRYALSYCTGLTSVTIGSGVTSILDRAFHNCSALKEVRCLAEQVPETDSEAFNSTDISSATLYVPESAYIEYSVTALWRDFGTVTDSDFEADGIFYKINEDGTSVSVGRTDNYKYSGDVVIPSAVTYEGVNYNVTSIGNQAFNKCSGLTSVKIPNSVRSIGNSAFGYCSGLTSVVIPESVTSIGGHAFVDCTGLTKAEFASIESLCKIEFADPWANPLVDAKHLYIDGQEVTDLVIPNSVTKIDNYTFYGCSGLTSVTIPNSVTSIEYDVFYGCSGLKEVFCQAEQVPETSKYAFEETNIASVTLYVPEAAVSAYQAAVPWNGFGSVKSIAFNFEADGIYYRINEDGESVSVTYRTTSYNSYSGSVEIPATVTYNDKQYSVTAIGENAFRNCTELTSLTIPNGVTTIDKSAVSGCWALTDITIPNSVTTIADYAFYDCRGIKTATIGSGVTSIGQYAFTYWNTITDVYCNAKQVPETHSDAFAGGNIANAKLHVPESAFSAYKSTAPWSGFGSFYSVTYDFKSKGGVYYKINEDGTSVSVTYDNATAYNTYSGSVRIPGLVTYDGKQYRVTAIGENAFRNCTELTSVEILYGVTTIAKSAFSGCWALTDITIPNSVNTIGDFAFYDCRGIKTATIGSGVTSIGQYAFTYWNAITEVWCLAEQQPTTHSDAFAGSNIANAVLYVPESLVDAYYETAPWSGFGTIKKLPYAFEADGIYYGIYSDDKSVYVTYRTEDGNSYSGSVVIPSTVTYNGKQYDVYYIDSRAFINCPDLTSVSIPDGVSGIDEYAFYNCTGLTSVTISKNVNYVGKYAFGNCSSLKEVYCMPRQLPTTGTNVFYNASISSATLYVPESAYNAYLTTAPWSGFGTIVTMPYDFEADGIYYSINEDGTSVSVTYRTADYNSYSGRVIIPSAVTYDGTEYSVTAIGESAFRNCSMLTGVAIPNSVTSIGTLAFIYCSNLTMTTIPNSVTSIGDYAYRYAGLEYISLGSGSTSIGANAFMSCSRLTQVYCRAEQVPATNQYAFQSTDLAKATLYVLESAVSAYKAASPWSGFGTITAIPCNFDFESDDIYYKINEDGTSVSVTHCGLLTYSGHVVIPAAVTYDGHKYKVTGIAEQAFYACRDLTSVTIPESVAKIENNAFGACYLNNVDCLAEQVPETHANAFQYTNIANATLYVPAPAVDAYKATAPWSGFRKIIGVEPAYILGDANDSNEVEIGDITAVLTLMANPEAVGKYNRKAADANKSGDIEIGDITTILTIMAGGK